MLVYYFCQYIIVIYQHNFIDIFFFYLYNNHQIGGVNELNERIKDLRKYLKLTQQEFADKIGISRGNIAAYEVAKNAPSNAVISLI